jgi:LemA protein
MKSWIFIAIIVVLVALIVLLYNRLVALRQARKNAFADIDVQLKLRYDLVPNLVNTVKGYAKHEREVFEQVTEARSQVGRAHSIKDRAQAEGMLSSALMGLFAVAENYPDLKANENFIGLQKELSDIENKVAAARRYFNNATNELNTKVQQFPSNIIAKMFGFHTEEFFDLGGEREETKKPVDVKF